MQHMCHNKKTSNTRIIYACVTCYCRYSRYRYVSYSSLYTGTSIYIYMGFYI